MIALAAPNWRTMLVPTVPVLEIVLRGSAIYLLVFTAMRFFRREAGGLGTPDLLVLVFVADAAQNAMAANYTSLTEGLVLVGTIFFWNWVLDWLGWRYRWAHRILVGAPLLLVRDGRIQWQNLRRELLTRADLFEQLREQGIEDVDEVRKAYLEADGRLSVIKRDASDDDTPRRAAGGKDRA